MSTVTLEDAKQRLVERVRSLPTEQEIVITLNDKPVARLTSVASQMKQIPPRFVVSSAAEPEEKLTEGVRQLDDGAGIPGDTAVQELRERAKARRPAGNSFSLRRRGTTSTKSTPTLPQTIRTPPTGFRKRLSPLSRCLTKRPAWAASGDSETLSSPTSAPSESAAIRTT